MKSERFFQEHPVKLTDEEIADRALENAELLGKSEEKAREIDDYAETSKATKKRLDGEKEALDAQCFRLGRIVRTRMEPRQVECEERDVMSTLTIETVRLDTGACVGSRAMTKDEIHDRQQIKLPLPRAERPAKPKREAEPTPAEVAEAEAIVIYLKTAALAASDDVSVGLTELAAAAGGMVDRSSIVGALKLASQSKGRSAAERKAISDLLKGVEGGAHLAKSN
jgi:hypothetical protein